MRIRCSVSGCQYGIEMLDKKPKNRCIWCGAKRTEGNFKGVTVPELVNLYQRKKNEKR